MASNVLADLLSGSASIFTQHNRLLRLRFARGSGLPGDALLPHTLKWEEGLSRCYRYELECLSPDVHLELKDLLGQAVEIAIFGGRKMKYIFGFLIILTLCCQATAAQFSCSPSRSMD